MKQLVCGDGSIGALSITNYLPIEEVQRHSWHEITFNTKSNRTCHNKLRKAPSRPNPAPQAEHDGLTVVQCDAGLFLGAMPLMMVTSSSTYPAYCNYFTARAIQRSDVIFAA
eukprot:3854611-Amphidinium_carterae.1